MRKPYPWIGAVIGGFVGLMISTVFLILFVPIGYGIGTLFAIGAEKRAERRRAIERMEREIREGKRKIIEFRAKIAQWKSEGYNVSELEEKAMKECDWEFEIQEERIQRRLISVGGRIDSLYIEARQWAGLKIPKKLNEGENKYSWLKARLSGNKFSLLKAMFKEYERKINRLKQIEEKLNSLHVKAKQWMEEGYVGFAFPLIDDKLKDPRKVDEVAREFSSLKVMFKEYERKIDRLKEIEGELNSLYVKAKQWSEEGYIVLAFPSIRDKLKDPTKVDEIEDEFSSLKAMFEEYQRKIERLKQIEGELNSLGVKGLDPEIHSIRERLNDPGKLNEIERELSSLKAIQACEENIQKAMAVIFPGDAEEILNQAKHAIKNNNFEKSLSLTESCMGEIENTKRQADPILSISFPSEGLQGGVWNRCRVGVTNAGKAHAVKVNIGTTNLQMQKMPTIPLIKAGESKEIEIAITLSASGSVFAITNFMYQRAYDNKRYKTQTQQWLDIGGAAAPTTMPAKQTTNLKVLCETENFRGFIRAKIAVFNNTGAVITDSRLRLITDNKVLRFDHVEPAYITHGQEIELGNINRREKKTVAIYLDPMMCTTTGLDATFTCRDIKGNIQMEKMRKKGVIVVCPIFFTEDIANPAMLKNLVANVLKQQDSKIFNIPQSLKPVEAFEVAKSAVSGRSVNFVREFSTPTPYQGEAWYYAVTKGTRMQMVIKVAVREDTNSIEIFAASQSEEALTGLLAELGHDLTNKLKEKGMPAVQVTNVTIKDSIIHKSSLLFGEGPGNVPDLNISDSIIHKTQIGGEKIDKTEKIPKKPDNKFPL